MGIGIPHVLKKVHNPKLLTPFWTRFMNAHRFHHRSHHKIAKLEPNSQQSEGGKHFFCALACTYLELIFD